MSLELKIGDLYSKLKKESKNSEVHTISVTNKEINYYVSENYETDKYSKKNYFKDIKDITFIDTTKQKLKGNSLKEYMKLHNFREKGRDGEVVFIYGNKSKIPQIFSIHNHFRF